ncbi:MAG: cell division protein FtsA [bacterium]
MRYEPIVGLDIGTTKVCTIIGGAPDEGGDIDIMGVGTTPSLGLRRGVIVNLDETVQSIRNAVREAELMAGVTVSNVYAGIAGAHIRGINSRGVIAVSRSDHEITPHDIERVIDAASAVAIPTDQQILHVLPQEFIIDDQREIEDPIGMSGVRLEAEVHIVTGGKGPIQNVVKSIRRAGLNVNDIILEPLASSYATLTEDEKKLGVVLADIGGGTTDIAVFVKGSLWHTAVLNIGGDQVTNDIAIGLRTPIAEAEAIKIKYACAMSSLVEDIEIEVPSVGGRGSRVISKYTLSQIVEPRMQEILELVQKEIRRSGYEDWIAAGVVLTGGASLIDGITELAEKVFAMPVRVAVPRKITGLVDVVNSPIYSTGVGLVKYGWLQQLNGRMATKKSDTVGKFWERVKSWLSDFF